MMKLKLASPISNFHHNNDEYASNLLTTDENTKNSTYFMATKVNSTTTSLCNWQSDTDGCELWLVIKTETFQTNNHSDRC